MAHYKTPARLPRQFIDPFTPWQLPPALHAVDARLLAHLWDIVACTGHPVLPHVYVLQRLKPPEIRVSVATDNYFIIVTAITEGDSSDKALLLNDHYMVMLGTDPRNMLTWHRDIAPEDIIRFMKDTDEELVEQGILNVNTGKREPGYTYVFGWKIRVACAFPARYSHIKVRPFHDAPAVREQCDHPETVVIVPDYFDRAVLCRPNAAREIFGPIAHELHKRRGKFDM